MTNTFETPAIEYTRVFHSTEGQTVFVTPIREEGYSFRVAAKLCQLSSPSFEHRKGGDIVVFSSSLSGEDIRMIGNLANVSEIVHYPGKIKNFEPQMDLARMTLGPIRS